MAKAVYKRTESYARPEHCMRLISLSTRISGLGRLRVSNLALTLWWKFWDTLFLIGGSAIFHTIFSQTTTEQDQHY
jgi:hypothetical protein